MNIVISGTLLAAHIRPQSAQYSPDYLESLLNYYDREQLAELAGSFPILDMLEPRAIPGARNSRYMIRMP